MKLRKALVRAAGLAVCGAAGPLLAAEPPSPYIQIGAGAQFLEHMKLENTSGTFTTRSHLNFKVGPVVTGAVGYAFGNGWRGEFEYGFRESPAKNLTLPSGATVLGSANLKANATVYTLMANAIYDFNLGGPYQKFVPHVGGGIGAVNFQSTRAPADTVFGGQAIAGIEYRYTPALSFGVDYRFIGSTSIHQTFTQEGITVGRSVQTHYYDHAVLFTARWKFGIPPLSPPAAGISPIPAAAAPPPPQPQAGATAPPPFSRDFTVLFATGSATLNRQARDTVREAANAAKENAPARINVGGHADTKGSPSVNQRLSERRAAAVRRALIADGVAPDEITTAAHGESELAVPTADNVSERQNRRVVIVVQGQGPST